MNMTFHDISHSLKRYIPNKTMDALSICHASFTRISALEPLEVESLEALELERTESLWSELCGGGRALSQTAEHRVQRLHSLQGSYWKSLPQGS